MYRIIRPLRDIKRVLIATVVAVSLSGCADTTAPATARSMTPPSAVSQELECGVDITCEECDPTDPNSPCYEPPPPGDVCESPICSGTNSVAFTSIQPDSGVVGGTYLPVAVGLWEFQGYPAILSSLTPLICPLSTGVVTFIAAGTCTIAADQPGGGDAPAALQVTQSFDIYSATWPFAGFFAPLSNSPKLNSANAGNAIPVKFSLAGDRGLDILATGSPSSVAIQCPSGSAISASSATLPRGKSGLSYNSLTDTYHYVWSTQKSWKNTCRLLTVALTDGSTHSVSVAFK